MDIISPMQGFTVYSKSGCLYCVKVKALLKEKNVVFTLVDCDDYILKNKAFFLQFIKEKANKEYKTFPMVFENGNFIGGYSETQQYLEKQFLSFEDNTEF